MWYCTSNSCTAQEACASATDMGGHRQKHISHSPAGTGRGAPLHIYTERLGFQGDRKGQFGELSNPENVVPFPKEKLGALEVSGTWLLSRGG